MISPLLFEIFVFNSLLHEGKSILTNTQVVGTDRVWSLRKTPDRKVFGLYLTATENHWKVLNMGRITQSDSYFKTVLWLMCRMDCRCNFITVTMHNCVCFWDTLISSLSCFLLYLQKATPSILSSKEKYSVFPSKFGFCPVLPPFACLHLIIYILKLSMM